MSTIPGLPEGVELVRYAVPVIGEYFIGLGRLYHVASNYPFISLIVKPAAGYLFTAIDATGVYEARKIEPPKPGAAQWLPEGVEMIGYRVPKLLEFYLSPEGIERVRETVSAHYPILQRMPGHVIISNGTKRFYKAIKAYGRESCR